LRQKKDIFAFGVLIVTPSLHHTIKCYNLGRMFDVKALARAQLMLLLERLWPFVFWLICALSLAFALSLFGFKFFALSMLLLGVAFALYQLKAFRKPTRDECLARLNEGQAHRPFTQKADVNVASTPLAQALWAQAQAQLSLNLPPLFPRLNTAQHDPYALRALVALGLCVALVQNPAWREAFDFSPAPQKGWRADMWVTPPAYTGLSPVMLYAAKDEGQSQRTTQNAFPAGSKISFRASGFTPNLSYAQNMRVENDLILEKDITLTLKGVPKQSALQFDLQALKDLPPSVRFTVPQFADEKNHLRLDYAVDDDYGVVSGQALLFLTQPSSFVKLPAIELTLPQGGKGEARSSQDLTTHPFAGLAVTLQLQVKDEKGQEGLSAKHLILLPSRNFTKPLAQSLIEQRQRLALSLEHKTEVVVALELLMLAPESFDLPTTHYLGLRTASTRLKRARNEAAHVSVIDYLYEIALAIEEGNLSEAEKELKAAQEALENALKNNADEKTLQQLTQNLKDAMQKMLQELAKDLENEPFSDENATDLSEQLKDLENLTKEGAREQAQRLLDELKQQMQEMMQAKREGRLRRANPQQQGKNQLSEMIRRQQQLRDKTFQDEGNPEAQQQLREDLDALKNDKLGQAGEAMREAEKQMRQGNKQGAMEAQRRALQGLQQEAQAQAQAERERQQGQGRGEGEAQGEGQREGRNTNDPLSKDPLGRQQQGKDDATTTKSPNLLSKPEQAQKILEELRKRAGENTRPQEERDYIERLLKGLK
jgi:Domain of unknown function (DUF4175)